MEQSERKRLDEAWVACCRADEDSPEKEDLVAALDAFYDIADGIAAAVPPAVRRHARMRPR